MVDSLVEISKPLRPAGPDWLSRINPLTRAVEESGIVEVFNYGRDRQGLIPLWVGEGDLVTPDFIAEAAEGSLSSSRSSARSRPRAFCISATTEDFARACRSRRIESRT